MSQILSLSIRKWQNMGAVSKILSIIMSIIGKIKSIIGWCLIKDVPMPPPLCVLAVVW